MGSLKNTSQFVSPNLFDALQVITNDNVKESDKQLIQNKTEIL